MIENSELREKFRQELRLMNESTGAALDRMSRNDRWNNLSTCVSSVAVFLGLASMLYAGCAIADRFAESSNHAVDIRGGDLRQSIESMHMAREELKEIREKIERMRTVIIVPPEL